MHTYCKIIQRGKSFVFSKLTFISPDRAKAAFYNYKRFELVDDS
jgi:hypothetical protein